jgi:cephalosporin hydroxylase
MLRIDMDSGLVEVDTPAGTVSHPIGTPEAFSLISQAWLRSGWDNKYVYGFSWMGRPIIQLPEDMIRIQELIYSVRPDVVIETGIAHGGSLIFYAGLMKAMDHGRVIGVDIEIRQHNRQAIEAHEMFERIRMVEGSSVDEAVIAEVRGLVSPQDRGMVILDSNHSYTHVLAELRAYAEFVAVNSYLVACDGIMQDIVGAERTQPDWAINNPQTAVREFLAERNDFVLEEPVFPFNEGRITQRVTYWPNAYLRRVA